MEGTPHEFSQKNGASSDFPSSLDLREESFRSMVLVQTVMYKVEVFLCGLRPQVLYSDSLLILFAGGWRSPRMGTRGWALTTSGNDQDLSGDCEKFFDSFKIK